MMNVDCLKYQSQDYILSEIEINKVNVVVLLALFSVLRRNYIVQWIFF